MYINKEQVAFDLSVCFIWLIVVFFFFPPLWTNLRGWSVHVNILKPPPQQQQLQVEKKKKKKKKKKST